MRSSLAVLFVLIAASAACGGSGSDASGTPVTPTPPAEVRLAVFMDSSSGFSTSDVRDVNDEIVRFDTASNSLIWAADGRTFTGYPVSGDDIGNFRVRFGTKNGQRAAYFTERSVPNICDLQVSGGQLVVSATEVSVPAS